MRFARGALFVWVSCLLLGRSRRSLRTGYLQTRLDRSTRSTACGPKSSHRWKFGIDAIRAVNHDDHHWDWRG